MLYKVSHLIPHKHLIYFIRHSLYIHLYQDRTTNSQLSHAVLSPRTPNARQTPRGRQDNHTDTSFITSTLDGNYRPSDLFIEPVNTTPSYGKPYVHNTMYGQMSHMYNMCLLWYIDCRPYDRSVCCVLGPVWVKCSYIICIICVYCGT